MITIGLCTHFSETDRLAFDFALALAQKRQAQLNICHWLNSPFILRRDIVPDDLFRPSQTAPVTPALLTHLEHQLRAYYEPLLCDFTNVAFKLCEGNFQVELARCFRRHQLDLALLGDQPGELSGSSQTLAEFAARTAYPLVIVQAETPRFRLNSATRPWLDYLDLPEQSWEFSEHTTAALLRL